MYQYKAKCLRVIDGDTAEFDLDLGFGIHYVVRGRLHNVNAPELFSGKNRHNGELAKKFLEEKLLNTTLIVNTYKDKMTYNRWVIQIHDEQNNNINEIVENYCKTLT